jgi:hypothetical protein
MNHRPFGTICSLIVLLSVAVACGDDDGGEGSGQQGEQAQCLADFGSEDACGGSAEGSYTLAKVCSDFDWQAYLSQYCAGVTVSSASYEGSGTLELDGSDYARQGSASVTLSLGVPESCAAAGCGAVEAQLQSAIGQNYDQGSADCSASGAGCDCQVDATTDFAASGGYTTSDGVLTTDDGRTFHYCVSGDTLQAREFGQQTAEANVTQVWRR